MGDCLSAAAVRVWRRALVLMALFVAAQGLAQPNAPVQPASSTPAPSAVAVAAPSQAVLPGPLAPVPANTPAHAPELNLTEAEKAWLAAHPVIRIGVDPNYAPYAFVDSRGQFAGVAAEITEIVRQRLGIRLELVRGLSWPQILEAARKRELDVITTAAHRPEREQYLVFTRNYLQTPLVVMTRTQTPQLRDVQQLARQRVALVKGYSSTGLVRERVPAIDTRLVNTPLDGLFALSQGGVDAYVGVLGINTYLAARNGIANLEVNALFDVTNGQAYGVRKDWPELANILQKALDTIPPDQTQQIFARWIPVSVESLLSPVSVLDPAARARLAALGELRVGVRKSLYPFDFVNANGQQDGLSQDVLEWLSNRMGIRYRFVAESDWPALHTKFAAGELDLVLGVNSGDPDIPAGTLSDPYFVSALGVFTRKSDVFLGAVGDLLDRRVVVRAGGFAEDILRDFPRILVQAHADIPKAAKALLDGEADYLVAETTSTLKVLEDSSIAGLRYAGPLTEGPVSLRLAVHPQLQDVRPLINAALRSMKPEEASEIRRRWVGTPVEQPWRVTRQVLTTAAALALLTVLGYGAFYIWNRSLRLEIDQRKQFALELEVEKQKALEADRIKSLFLATMSHELRTPLNSIIGFTGILKQGLAGPVNAEQDKQLGMVATSARHLLALINDVLDISRIEAGELKLELAPVDLRAAIDMAMGVVRPQADKKGLALSAGPLPTLAMLTADRRRVEQILINLLNNAVKFTERGEVGLSVEQNADWVRVHVSDTGIGMRQEDLAVIFQPFRQIDLGAGRNREGTGLGLAICVRLAAMMGGKIQASSVLGEGSRFTLNLPLAKAGT
jgi:polar amino acid transport system substrate-binding protein